MAPKARHAKGKARITAYEQLLNARPEDVARELEIYIPPGPRLGDVVIEADKVAKGFGDKLLLDNVTFALPQRGRGGHHRPQRRGQDHPLQDDHRAGDARRGHHLIVGETVSLAYVDQTRSDLDPEKTVYEVISDGLDNVQLGKVTVNARAYCARFNFTGADQQKKVDMLSGGERNRVHLARMLKSGANVLLLDEPTNDLDVNTLRALEDALDQLRRVRPRHQPRPLVPRPHRHPHPRLRGRQQGHLLRGQLPGVRGGPPQAASAKTPPGPTGSPTGS